MRQIASAITTPPREAYSATGTQHGERGLATLENSQVATWLSKQAPADMDKAAVSRALSHGVALKVRYDSRYPSGPNGERLPSYDVAIGCEVSGGNIEAALSDLRNFLTPAPIRQIEGWLAELSVIVAKRADDEFAEELRVTAYASRLSRYPADVVRSVLLKNTYRFFPTWDELEKRCEALTSPRRHMIAALERGPAPPEPIRRPPTDEERARIKALIDEMFPMRSQEMRDAAVDEALKGDCMVGEPNDD
jgi:hypothetical protein